MKKVQRHLGQPARLLPKKIFKEPAGPNAEKEKLRSQTCEMLGAAAKTLLKTIFLGAPGYHAPVKQQPWSAN